MHKKSNKKKNNKKTELEVFLERLNKQYGKALAELAKK